MITVDGREYKEPTEQRHFDLASDILDGVRNGKPADAFEVFSKAKELLGALGDVPEDVSLAFSDGIRLAAEIMVPYSMWLELLGAVQGNVDFSRPTREKGGSSNSDALAHGV